MWLAITGLSRPLNLPPSMPASDKICFLLMLNCLPQFCGTTVAPEQSDMFHSGPCKAITSQLDVLKPIEHTTNHLWKCTRYQLPRYTVRNAPITNSWRSKIIDVTKDSESCIGLRQIPLITHVSAIMCQKNRLQLTLKRIIEAVLLYKSMWL